MKKFLFNKLLPNVHKFYLSINLKPKNLEINENNRFLLLAPHADDESISSAGLLIKNPDKFKVICLTDGAKGAKDLSYEQAVELRKKEFINAMNFAEIKDFEFLNIPDKNIITNYDKFSQIDINNFDMIFIPNILDQHIDHKSVALNLKKLIEDKPHKKELKIAMYEVWSSLAMPNFYYNISDVIDKKRAMIELHASQVKLKQYTQKAIGLNSFRGLHFDIDYAEAFTIIDINTFNKLCKLCV